MNAAVINTWGAAPIYSTLDLPEPTQTQHRIRISHAAVHNLVRSRAAGKHFSVANRSPPHVPGTDGVGTLPSGEKVYFNALASATGSFAEEINVEKKDVFALPDGAREEDVAMLLNPAMSSWMALKARAQIAQGDAFKVAIVGATGVSGQTAVQISKALGATTIVAIGKPGEKLERTKQLGATEVIALASEPKGTDWSATSEVDVVLDYLYGDVSRYALPGIVAARKHKSPRLTWVEIGALGGDELGVSGALLRSANVVLLGCGPGSWTFPELGRELPGMLKAIVDGGLRAEYRVEGLKEVESWWGETGGKRVLVKI